MKAERPKKKKERKKERTGLRPIEGGWIQSTGKSPGKVFQRNPHFTLIVKLRRKLRW